MTILFLVTRAVLGGHVLSALTIARRMQRSGHQVLFAGGGGALAPVIANEMPFHEIPIPMFHDSRQHVFTYFTWKSFSSVRSIKKLLSSQHIDMVHVFDARAYICGCIAASLANTPISCTLCGGIDPHYNIPLLPKLMVFSEEQRQRMIHAFHWKPDRVEVVRTRLDAEGILSAAPINIKELTDRYALDPNGLKVMMISSFDGTKIRSLGNALDAAVRLLDKGLRFQMVFIGGEGRLFEDFRRRADAVNDRYRTHAIVCTGPLHNAYGILPHADIVLGVGRSAFEGMLYEKPTVVVGENGFAGIVSEQSLQSLAYYNFSGRNQSTPASPTILADNVEMLLAAPGLRATLGAFGKRFVLDEIDVVNGLLRIEAVYKINSRCRALPSRLWEKLSVPYIMVPIWRDNFYSMLSLALKRRFGFIRD